MFRRKHHQRISEVLQRLDDQLLRDHACYFGGGTAVALMHDEYRESVDIDFLVSDLEHYRDLRELLRGPQGIAAITKSGRELVLAREIRTDQYGIRTAIKVGDAHIKFEIISEGRIEFDIPEKLDCIDNIATLTRVDLTASKLLANADRWNDDSVFSRDVLDLAMMKVSQKEFQAALAKARPAYGDSVLNSLSKSIDRVLTTEGLLERCMTTMRIDTPKAILWQNIEHLMGVAGVDSMGGGNE